MTTSRVLYLWLALMLSACGGGGSSPANTTSSASNTGSSATSGNSATCVNLWSASCAFSANDTQQLAQGWWSGTRTLSNGESQSAIALVTSSNAIQIYLGDQLSQGQLKGNFSLTGSLLSGLNLTGADQTKNASSSSAIASNSGTGGVVTGAHLKLQVDHYLPDPNNPSGSPLSMQMQMNFNALGSNALSSLAGQYSDASGDVLSISTAGGVSMSYSANVYQIDQGVFSYVTCKDNYSADPHSTLSSLTLTSASANNCGVTNSIMLYALPLNSKQQIAVLGLGKIYLFQ